MSLPIVFLPEYLFLGIFFLYVIKNRSLKNFGFTSDMNKIELNQLKKQSNHIFMIQVVPFNK